MRGLSSILSLIRNEYNKFMMTSQNMDVFHGQNAKGIQDKV